MRALTVALLLLVLVVGPAGVRAQDATPADAQPADVPPTPAEPGHGQPPDRVPLPPRPGPRNARLAMGASTLFPGLGQLYNEEGLRTLVVFTWEAYYLSVILREGQRADLYKRHAAALAPGESWLGLDHEALRARFAAHEERQTDYVWYTGALLLASILDAYVFANLHDFETDDIRGRRAALLPHVDPGGRAVGLALRWRF